MNGQQLQATTQMADYQKLVPSFVYEALDKLLEVPGVQVD
jgi:hypothetical protein